MHYVQPQSPSPMVVNQQFLQPALPQQVMFVPQIQVNPQFQAMLPMYTGLTMLSLQNQAGQTPFRTFVFNLMSANGYQNQEFAQLMQFVVDSIEFNLVGRRMPEQQAVIGAVEDSVLWTMAARVLQNHQFLAQFLNQQVIADFNHYVSLAKQQGANIQGMRQQQAMPAVQQNYGAVPQQNYGGAPQMYAQPTQYGNNGALGNAYVATTTAMADATGIPVRPSVYNDIPSRSPGMVPQAAVSQISAPRSMGAAESVTSAMQTGKWGDLNPAGGGIVNRPPAAVEAPRAVQRGWGPAPAAPAVAAVAVPAVVRPTTPAFPEDGVAPAATTARDTVVVNSDRLFDRVVLDDLGVVIVPAYQHPSVSATWSMTNPYKLAYDPVEYLLNYSIESSAVSGRELVAEVLTPWSVELDYMRHELDINLVHKEARRREIMGGKKQAFNFHAVEMLRPDPELMVSRSMPEVEIPAIGETFDLSRVEVYRPDSGDYRLVNDLVSGVATTRAKLREAGLPGLSKSSVEMYFDIPEIFVVLPEHRTVLEQLASSVSFGDLLLAMSEASAQLDGEVLEQLDARVTAIVNHVLTKGVGLEVTIDSFLEDWTDLTALLTTRHGEDLIDLIEVTASDFISAGLRVLDEETSDLYLTALHEAGADADAEFEDAEQAEVDGEGSVQSRLAGLMDEDDIDQELPESEATYVNVLMFERVSVTTITCTRDDMDVELNTGSLVTEKYLPSLRGGLASILARTADMPVPFRHRYLLTTDGALLEIVKGVMAPDAILLFDAK